jgi:DNA-binding transcriptional ArsR family regulator
MRLRHGLSDLLASPNHLKVLRALSILPIGLERSGRDIARRAGMSQPTAAKVLDDLVSHGAVTMRRVPPAKYYALNRDHVLVQTILEALATERSLRDQVLQFVWQQLLPAGLLDIRLFGSAAREEMRSDSDADLALISSSGRRDQVVEASSDLYEQVWRRFGVRPNFLVGEGSIDEMASSEASSAGVWHRVRDQGLSIPA